MAQPVPTQLSWFTRRVWASLFPLTREFHLWNKIPLSLTHYQHRTADEVVPRARRWGPTGRAARGLRRQSGRGHRRRAARLFCRQRRMVERLPIFPNVASVVAVLANALVILAMGVRLNRTVGFTQSSIRSARRPGGSSCKDPNLQNIPKLGKGLFPIRSLFQAPPGRKLVIADFAQMELVAAAVLAPEPKMLAAFQNGEDLHCRTAEVSC